MAEEKKISGNMENIDLRKEVLDEIGEKEKITQPEKERAPETAPEQQRETGTEKELADEGRSGPEPASTPASSQAYEARQKEIEDIMAKDLDELYLELPENKRMAFKKVGEETALKINELMIKGKSAAKKIVGLIKKWLSMIPGVNKYFLEQEAKIKTDEILKLVK